MGNADGLGPSLTRPLTAAAALLALAGLVLLALGVVGQLSTATPNMRGFNAGQTIEVGDSGMSVYARSDAVREEAICTATGEGAPVTLDRPVEEYSLDVAGSDFYEVARTPGDFAEGTYAVSCEGTQQSVYAGPRATRTVATGILGTTGLALGSVLLGVALLLALVALLLRRRRPGAQEPNPYQYGSHAGAAGSTAYPQQPYGPPGGYQAGPPSQGGYYPAPSSPQGWGEQGPPSPGQGTDPEDRRWYGERPAYGDRPAPEDRPASEDPPAYGDSPPPPPPPRWGEDEGTGQDR